MKVNIFSNKEKLIERVTEIVSGIKGSEAIYLMNLTLDELSWQTEGEYYLVVKHNGYSALYANMRTIHILEQMENVAFIISICIGDVNAITIFKTDSHEQD